jgi:hypothetical protein
MVFKLVIRFLKYLFSSLKKDASFQHKEEKVEKKEKRRTLNEFVIKKKEAKQNKKIHNDLLQITVLSEELIPKLGNFLAQLKLYLKTKDSGYLVNVKEMFDYFIKEFNIIVELWRNLLSRFEEVKKEVEKILNDDLPELNKELSEENKIINKEYKNLVRSNKKGKNLDQTEKEAIIKKKVELLRESLALLEKIKSNYQSYLDFINSNYEKANNVVSDANKLDQRIHQHQKKWSDFYRLFKRIESFFKMEQRLNGEIGAVEGQVNHILAQEEEYDQESLKLIEKREILDKEYGQFLINEEIAQQKGEDVLPKAA